MVPPTAGIIELIEELHIGVCPHGQAPRDVGAHLATQEAVGIPVAALDIEADEDARLVEHFAESLGYFKNGLVHLAAVAEFGTIGMAVEDLDYLYADV